MQAQGQDGKGQSWPHVLLKPWEELQQLSPWLVRAWSVFWGRGFSQSTDSSAALRLPWEQQLPQQWRGGGQGGGVQTQVGREHSLAALASLAK